MVDRLYDAGEKENIKWIACGCVPYDEWRLKYCLQIAYPDSKHSDNAESTTKELSAEEEERMKRLCDRFGAVPEGSVMTRTRSKSARANRDRQAGIANTRDRKPRSTEAVWIPSDWTAEARKRRAIRDGAPDRDDVTYRSWDPKRRTWFYEQV